ncbi:Lon protease family protein [Gottschalkia acidurici]|uniref:Lon protease family protein n=1 Tax=Clostridium acidurici TaxID=1556 RepID=UPI0002E9D60F|nr:ATP-binding protein [Gottschalkia acidurici]
MGEKLKVPLYKLKRRSDLSKYKIETTKDVAISSNIIGQNRGVNSLEFGLSVNKKGYNIYVSGITGTGRTSHSYSLALRHSKNKETPDDWCYVYNFINPETPKSIRLKAGDGKRFKYEVENSIEKIKESIEESLSSKDYEDNRELIYKYFKKKTEEVIIELNEKAKEYNFTFKKTEGGLVSIPLIDGKQLEDEEIEKLPKRELYLIRENSNRLEAKTIEIVKKIIEIEQLLEDKLIELEERTVSTLIETHFNPILDTFGYNKKIKKYLTEMKEDIILNINEFIADDENSEEVKKILIRNKITDDFFKRYQVNLFIDNSENKGAPVIKEINPTYYNLLGKIEYFNEMGFLKTDHTRIKPGAIHLANGGYLLLSAKDILSNLLTWEGLKKCLMTKLGKIENISKDSVVAESIKPEAIPLDIKIILIGDYYTYQLLYNYDEDFKKLFRIKADFDIEMERNDGNIEKLLSFVASHCKRENLKPFDRGAIEEIIEYSSRIVEHQDKLTTQFNEILEVMYEGDAWARYMGSDIVKREDIRKAIDEKIYRNNRYEEKIQQMIKDDSLIIDTASQKIGEINGLAVIDMGEYSFGKPNKITASTFAGRDGIINIEREVNKSGSNHDKGVLILSGFMGEEFAKKKPLSLSASITFEQCYSVVDGDSASSTELYALLSSLSDLPINQGISTTGSINQKGIVQTIGGVNEKIEGFFKICKAKGLTGNQGVIIPYQNVENLMLRDEVLEAVNEGNFNIYAIKNVKEGIEILTGVPYGTRDDDGNFEVGTVGYFVQRKLEEYSKNTSEYS